MTGPECIAKIREQTDTVMLSFSRGKDSIGAWLEVRKYFKRVIPFYCYRVPNLDFTTRSLAYYEKFFQTKIYRLPHPSTPEREKRQAEESDLLGSQSADPYFC